MSRLDKSKHRYVKKNHRSLSKLCELASDLDFEVKFQATKFMLHNSYVGMMSPQLGLIFIDPNQSDIVETLAHELGHVVIFCLTGSDTDEDEELDEDIADMIGIALCKALGYKPKTLTRKR